MDIQHEFIIEWMTGQSTKMKNNCGIYKITNKINNKVYIGQSIDIKQRWRAHIYAANQHQDTHLYRAINHYGLENFVFEIIEVLEPNRNLLDDREKYWINYYDSYNTGYNSTLGGQGNQIMDYQEILNLWNQKYSTKYIANKFNCSTDTIVRIYMLTILHKT